MDYEIYADGQFRGGHPSLVSACAIARTDAVRLAGTRFVVKRGGAEVATYEMRAGKLAAWMR